MSASSKKSNSPPGKEDDAPTRRCLPVSARRASANIDMRFKKGDEIVAGDVSSLSDTTRLCKMLRSVLRISSASSTSCGHLIHTNSRSAATDCIASGPTARAYFLKSLSDPLNISIAAVVAATVVALDVAFSGNRLAIMANARAMTGRCRN